MEIHERGGGIHYTVNCTRQSTSDELYQSLNKRLWTMLRYGTTTVETKSGYGLNTESEVKMLQVLKRANEEHPISLSITYCGAHAVPKFVNSVCIYCNLVYLLKRYVIRGGYTINYRRADTIYKHFMF